jgi:YVTN family beta-propeller protein
MKAQLVLLTSLTLGLMFSACQDKDSVNQPITPSDNPSAWVVNSLGGTLSRVDLVTDSVVTNVLTLGQTPNDIVISGTTGYVVNSGDNDIQIIDLQTAQTIGTIELYLGLNPYFITVGGAGQAFVTNLLTGNVSILDLALNQEIDTLNVGVALEGICIYGDTLYISDINAVNWVYGQGYVYAYSLPGLAPLATIPVGTNPQAIVAGPDGFLHVVCTGDYGAISGQVQIIDPATLTVVDSVTVGGTPGSLAFDSQGRAFLGAGGWVTDGFVFSYDGMTHQLLHGASNPILVPKGAYDVNAITTGNILVCCHSVDQVVEMDHDGNILQTYPVGDGPAVLAIWEP